MIYDIIIIGGAPAGLTAGLYGARQGNSVLILEKEEFGGQAIKTSLIENYPGFDPTRPSHELIDIMRKQVETFGAEIRREEVVSVNLKSEEKTVETTEDTYKARSVILATGANPRKLGVPGEEEFTGKGVAYCATCDAPFFQDLDVYVVGGGNSAVDEALYLTKFARKVTMLVRGDKLTCDYIGKKRVEENKKIEITYNHSITEFRGKGLLNEMTVKNNLTGEEKVIKPREGDLSFGVFIFIGYVPNTGMFKDELYLDDWGYIITDEKMRTEIPGIYAAGDCRAKELMQVITAASDGAIAAHFAGKDLDNLKDS